MALRDTEFGEDDDGYTEYVTAKAPWLRKVAFLLCQDWHRADDLTQTTIIKLHAHWRRVRRTGNLDGYARTILVNAFISEQRSHWWKRVTLFAGPAAGAEPEPAEQLAAGLERDLDLGLDLETALAAIPPRQRAVIVLRYYCDLSVEETASALRCSAGTLNGCSYPTGLPARISFVNC